MFNQAFQEFLNVIVASTDDPQLRVQISQAADKLTLATNDYTTVYNQAVSAYNDSVANNDPPFDKWLGTPPGKGWQTQIIAKGTTVDQAQKNYNNLVDQANTPGLADAQNQFKNQDFYSKLTDPGLSSFPRCRTGALQTIHRPGLTASRQARARQAQPWGSRTVMLPMIIPTRGQAAASALSKFSGR